MTFCSRCARLANRPEPVLLSWNYEPPALFICSIATFPSPERFGACQCCDSQWCLLTAWEESLFQRWPLLFAELHGAQADESSSLARDTIPTGKGWRPLLERTAANLHALVEREPAEARGCFTIVQVKNKGGKLRIHVSNAAPTMIKILAEAEEESASVCEICGQPGNVRLVGFILGACDACQKRQ
jgi:hypothetical protein